MGVIADRMKKELDLLQASMERSKRRTDELLARTRELIKEHEARIEEEKELFGE